MLEDIDGMVSNDWAFDMIDLKINIHKTTKDKVAYHEFTQKEAQEMSETLGKIYTIAHAVTCKACGNQYKRKA